MLKIVVLSLIASLASLNASADIVADFTASRRVAGVGVDLTFKFTGSSSAPGPVSLIWNFGDGSPSANTEEVRHAFSRSGKFVVKLTASNNQNETSEKHLEVDVRENLSPSAEFFIRRTDPLIGQDVTYYSMAMDYDGLIESSEWLLDDGLIGTGMDGVLKFSQEGEHRFQHRVTDNLGAVVVAEKVIKVRKENVPPTVRLVIQNESVFVGQRARLIVDAADSDGRIEKILWKFGDPAPFQEGPSQVDYSFSEEGFKIVTVKVIDDRGAEAISKGTLYVENQGWNPEVRIEILRKSPRRSEAIGFLLQAGALRKNIQAVEWDFGDGNKVIESSPYRKVSHVFNQGGEFTITAKLTYTDGTFQTASEKLKVDEAAIGPFTVPNQVLIESTPYFELIPTQEVTLNFSAYSTSGSSVSGSPVIWTSTSPSVSIVSTGSNWAELKGISAGSSEIRVNVEGKDSQSITIAVQPFTNNAAVAKYSDFIDYPFNLLYAGVNFNTGTYTFSLSYAHTMGAISVNTYADVRSSWLFFEMPEDRTTIDFKASSGAVTYSMTKTGLKKFTGKDGILMVPGGLYFETPFDYDDDRFLRFDRDFTYSFWISPQGLDNSGIYFEGDYLMYTTASEFVLSTEGGTLRKIKFPYKGAGKWANVAVTYEASTRTIRGYYDGTEVGSIQVPNSPWFDPSNKISIIGYDYSSEFDQIRFWNTKRTATQIKSELFTPTALPSAEILASFSFDVNTSIIQEDEAGGAWKIRLVPDGEPTSSYFASVMQARDWDWHFFVQPDFENEFTETVKGRKWDFVFPAGTFDSNRQFHTSLSDCNQKCINSTSYFRTQKISDVINISPITTPNSGTYPHFKMPFNTRSSTIDDPRKIKIVHYFRSIFGTELTRIYEPFELNLEQGYAAQQLFESGSSWIAALDEFDPVQYSNSDLKQSVVSYWGARNFYTTIPTANTTYVLSVSSSESTIARITCNNASVSGSSFPITLTGLTLSTNYCYVFYNWSTLLGPVSAEHYDLITIIKN